MPRYLAFLRGINLGKRRPEMAELRALFVEMKFTDVDDFCVEGREFYWLCRIKSNESNAWTSPDMKAVKLPTTSMRNLTTVRKLAALYPAPAA